MSTTRETDRHQAPPEAPVRREARAAVQVLERLLVSLPVVRGHFDRGAAAAVIEAAVAALARLEASGVDEADHLDLIDQATAQVRRAQAAVALPEGHSETERAKKTLGDIDQALARARERTLDVIIAWQDQVLRSGGPRVQEHPAPRPFQASAGIPRLHVVDLGDAPSWLRTVPDEEDEEEGEPGEELREGAEEAADRETEGEDEDIGEAMASEMAEDLEALRALDALTKERPRDGQEDALFEDVGLERIARDCMEEIGVLGMLRSARTTVTSLSALERFEKRLIENLDALVALSLPYYRRAPGGKGWVETRLDLLKELHRYTGDTAVPDPNRAFTLAFVLGCLEGELPVRAAMIAFRQAHPITYEAIVEALILGVNPGIGPALARMCADAPPEILWRALDVLQARREVPFARTAVLLRHPSARVRRSAAAAMGVVRERAAAVQVLERVLEIEVDADVAATVAESLAILGAASGVTYAQRRLAEDLNGPGTLPNSAARLLERLLALGGGPSDAAIFTRLLEQGLESADAVGWFGCPALMEPLIAALERANRESRAASRRPTALELEAARALYRITGAAITERAPNSGGGPEECQPAPDASRWQAWWTEQRGRFDPAKKYRSGRAFSPLLMIEELSTDVVNFIQRTTAVIEAALIAGRSRIDVYDWVARQREGIVGLRGQLGGSAR